MSYFPNLTQSKIFKKTWFYLTRTQPAFTCLKSTIETPEQKCEICSKLTIMTSDRHQWHGSGVFTWCLYSGVFWCVYVAYIQKGKYRHCIIFNILKAGIYRHLSIWLYKYFIVLLFCLKSVQVTNCLYLF